MKRKIIGIMAALLLAGIGTAALVIYVESAKDRAVATEELVDVYVVRQPIPKGTPVGQIKGLVQAAELPTKAVAVDAVTDLTTLGENLVAAVDLQPGEQLLTSRLTAPTDLSRVEVPAGLQELTLALDPERSVGGSLTAGDTVGVVLSHEPPAMPYSTQLTFHKILVTSVKFAADDPANPSAVQDEGDTADTAEQAPAGQLLVTMAMQSSQVEQVVFAAEYGHVWLTAENANATESTRIVDTVEEAYDVVAR